LFDLFRNAKKEYFILLSACWFFIGNSGNFYLLAFNPFFCFFAGKVAPLSQTLQKRFCKANKVVLVRVEDFELIFFFQKH